VALASAAAFPLPSPALIVHHIVLGERQMRKRVWMMVAAVLVCGIGSGAFSQAAGGSEPLLGSWAGRWEGGGGTGGRFDITLQKAADKLAGEVSVGQDAGDYVAKFTSVSIDANKLTARYDYPPDGQAEIILNASFEGSTGDGTWAMVEKGQDAANAFVSGTWKVSKK
jgi:hypothetical protein